MVLRALAHVPMSFNMIAYLLILSRENGRIGEMYKKPYFGAFLVSGISKLTVSILFSRTRSRVTNSLRS